MLIIKQYRIFRQDIQNNRQVLYVFGDNLERIGFGGQAKEMRGEVNSFGFATKRKVAHGTDDCYFHDGQYDLPEILEEEFKRLCKSIAENDYHAVVLPLDGIGTGLSKLPEYAPKFLKKINFLLGELKYL